MKYVKKIAAIFCAVMMVVTINASVVNAASTDEGNPTVITLISGSTMSGSAAGIFAEGETDHYFKFSLGSSSSYPDVMAVYLTNPDGCNYQMEITDPQNGIIYRGIGKAGTNDKVIKIPKPEKQKNGPAGGSHRRGERGLCVSVSTRNSDSCAWRSD